MWHEARKQERKIRSLMVDYRKRSERRRQFYEKIKLDPAQFLRAYGRPLKIHLDPQVAIQAESPQSMMPWSGDTDIKIDRFDVRAHLDFIPDKSTLDQETKLSRGEQEEERKVNYERYRILVQNECAGVSEEQCLKQLYMDEMFGALDKDKEKEEEERKKKIAEKKAAIGYTYEDSTPAQEEEENKEEDEEELDSDEDVDLDAVFDIDKLTTEQTNMLNLCGQQYGMEETDYFDNMWQDKEDAEELKQARLLEEERAQYAGRKSRRERRAYKAKKLKDISQMSPPSYAERASPEYKPYRESSSSRSPSPAPKRGGQKFSFITSFGGSSDEEGKVVCGPTLPDHLLPKSARSKSRSVFLAFYYITL